MGDERRSMRTGDADASCARSLKRDASRVPSPLAATRRGDVARPIAAKRRNRQSANAQEFHGHAKAARRTRKNLGFCRFFIGFLNFPLTFAALA
ncbi:hypothetical protein ACI2IY_09150 [Lysobacter enzymogenes]|uniref:hypothetical protein n=1 Tax=Lysobacter enzymogenes TaxID=69 RepID=UPI00384C0932